MWLSCGSSCTWRTPCSLMKALESAGQSFVQTWGTSQLWLHPDRQFGWFVLGEMWQLFWLSLGPTILDAPRELQSTRNLRPCMWDWLRGPLQRHLLQLLCGELWGSLRKEFWDMLWILLVNKYRQWIITVTSSVLKWSSKQRGFFVGFPKRVDHSFFFLVGGFPLTNIFQYG